VSEAAADYDLAAVVVYPRDHGQPADLARYLDGRIDGLIIRCLVPSDIAVLHALAVKRLPLVALWQQSVPEGVAYVDVDHYGGMYRAVRHLLDLGHRRIAFCSVYAIDHLNPHFPARVEGYRQALIDAGIAPISRWLVTQPDQLLGLLRGPEPVTAVCTFNDAIAREVAAVFDAAGVCIPGDVSLVGFDNLPDAEHVAGGLTTVDHPIREMGREAVRCLAALIAGTAVEACRVVLPTPMVIRQSTAPIAASFQSDRTAR
jgi:LacI family transcriptional regulator